MWRTKIGRLSRVVILFFWISRVISIVFKGGEMSESNRLMPHHHLHLGLNGRLKFYKSKEIFRSFGKQRLRRRWKKMAGWLAGNDESATWSDCSLLISNCFLSIYSLSVVSLCVKLAIKILESSTLWLVWLVSFSRLWRWLSFFLSFDINNLSIRIKRLIIGRNN